MLSQIGNIALGAFSVPIESERRPGFSTANYTRVGWTIGYGTEFDLGKNWSAKAEYDYLSFGRHTALATDGTTFLTDKSRISQVKIGVNYGFAPGVVVAKY